MVTFLKLKLLKNTGTKHLHGHNKIWFMHNVKLGLAIKITQAESRYVISSCRLDCPTSECMLKAHATSRREIQKWYIRGENTCTELLPKSTQNLVLKQTESGSMGIRDSKSLKRRISGIPRHYNRVKWARKLWRQNSIVLDAPSHNLSTKFYSKKWA